MSEDRTPDGKPLGPYDRLEVLARQSIEITPTLRHIELFTMTGLVTLLWHGPADAERVVLAFGGAMGGLLGPADGLYHDVGTTLADVGIATVRVGYRRPNDLPLCTHDGLAVAHLASRSGAMHFITMGHSFGGAVAVQVGVIMGEWTAGVVTLATQSAGCESADELAGVPMLLLHGDRDEILPSMASEVVHGIAGGHGALEILPGTGHLLTEAGPRLRSRIGEWIPAQFDGHTPPS